jgi:hypothetical protein
MAKALKSKKAKAKKTRTAKRPLKRKVRKAAGKRKMVKKVAKKVTKKIVRKVMAKVETAGMVGTVVHYYDRIGVAVLKLKAPVAVGDVLLFKRGAAEFVQTVDSLQIDHASVQRAGKGKDVGMKVNMPADRGTLVTRA